MGNSTTLLEVDDLMFIKRVLRSDFYLIYGSEPLLAAWLGSTQLPQKKKKKIFLSDVITALAENFVLQVTHSFFYHKNALSIYLPVVR